MRTPSRSGAWRTSRRFRRWSTLRSSTHAAEIGRREARAKCGLRRGELHLRRGRVVEELLARLAHARLVEAFARAHVAAHRLVPVAAVLFVAGRRCRSSSPAPVHDQRVDRAHGLARGLGLAPRASSRRSRRRRRRRSAAPRGRRHPIERACYPHRLMAPRLRLASAAARPSPLGGRRRFRAAAPFRPESEFRSSPRRR